MPDTQFFTFREKLQKELMIEPCLFVCEMDVTGAGGDAETMYSQLDCMVLQRTWKRADGSELGLSRALQHSGGHATAEVHRRCKDRAHVLWPYRGSPDLTGPWKRGTDTVTHARLIQGNANYYKAQLANKREITAMD